MKKSLITFFIIGFFIAYYVNDGRGQRQEAVEVEYVCINDVGVFGSNTRHTRCWEDLDSVAIFVPHENLVAVINEDLVY